MICVNNLLQNRNLPKAVDELILNLKKTATKCMSFGVILWMKKIISMCKHNSFGYINNGNISNIHFFDNCPHLLESGMCVLANNFICRLNHFLLAH